jgi:DMSO/TMAO reductase YedYZ heme-binding membrane subunit
MSEILWFLTRASGVVALVLIVAAVADGLVFSGREGGRRLRPAWWMDLHRGLGGYALIFTGVHLITAYGAGLGVSLATIFVPNASETFASAFTLGVLAFYAIAITVFSSWPKRRFRRTLWHALHLLSIPAALAVGIHGWQLGTDATTPWYIALMIALTGVVVYPLVLRLSGLARRRRALDSAPPTDPTTPHPPRPADVDDRVLVHAGD